MMNDENNYLNNPLHGVSLKTLLTEMVGHYGFDILFAYLNIKCFKTNPSIDSSVKFLKKTDWAREKVEAFYMYQYKSFPRASDEQFELAPRMRVIPKNQTAGKPAILSMEDAEKLREKRAKKLAERGKNDGSRPGRSGSAKPGATKRDSERRPTDKRRPSNISTPAVVDDSDPWAQWKV